MQSWSTSAEALGAVTVPKASATKAAVAMALNTVGLSAGSGQDGGTTARSASARLTPARLGEVWPEVAERLGKLLACRGVDPVLAEDIVQDVAVRALDKQVPFTDPADLYRWAAVAARNIHIDHVRCGGRTTEVESLVGVPDGTDVAYAVERRVALSQVWQAIAVLRPGEREAILGTLDERRGARTSGALVRRHRARATLRKAVGGLIATTAAARLRLRAVSPMLRTAGAVAVLTPVVALDLGGGAIGALDVHRGTGPTAPAPAVVVRTVAARSDAGSARGTGATVRASRAIRATTTTVTEPVVRKPSRDKTTVPTPGGNGEVGHRPKQPGEGTFCADGVPMTTGSVCVQEVPVPTL